jgi:hypothetical protein
MASEASEAAAEHTAEDEGQTAPSQPSQAPTTAAEPRNTNTEETMMGRRAPQSAREKTAMEETVGVMMWPSWAQRASGGLLGPCILEPAGPWTFKRIPSRPTTWPADPAWDP